MSVYLFVSVYVCVCALRLLNTIQAFSFFITTGDWILPNMERIKSLDTSICYQYLIMPRNLRYLFRMSFDHILNLFGFLHSLSLSRSLSLIVLDNKVISPSWSCSPHFKCLLLILSYIDIMKVCNVSFHLSTFFSTFCKYFESLNSLFLSAKK